MEDYTDKAVKNVSSIVNLEQSDKDQLHHAVIVDNHSETQDSMENYNECVNEAIEWLSSINKHREFEDARTHPLQSENYTNESLNCCQLLSIIQKSKQINGEPLQDSLFYENTIAEQFLSSNVTLEQSEEEQTHHEGIVKNNSELQYFLSYDDFFQLECDNEAVECFSSINIQKKFENQSSSTHPLENFNFDSVQFPSGIEKLKQLEEEPVQQEISIDHQSDSQFKNYEDLMDYSTNSVELELLEGPSYNEITIENPLELLNDLSNHVKSKCLLKFEENYKTRENNEFVQSPCNSFDQERFENEEYQPYENVSKHFS